jgi:HK97 family phage major capsid protein
LSARSFGFPLPKGEISMPTLAEMADEIQTKRAQLTEKFQAKPDLSHTEDETKEITRLNTELGELTAEYEKKNALERIRLENEAEQKEWRTPVNRVPHPTGGGGGQGQPERKTAGQMFVESDALKQFKSGNGRGPLVEVKEFEYKTTMLEGGPGFAPQSLRTGRVVESAQQMPKIADLIPQVSTIFPAVVYMLETVFTNAAVETAEAALYPEAALSYAEESSPVRKIPVFIPVTDEQLADVQGIQQRIDNRLDLMIKQRLDRQIVSGDGIAPNLTGIMNTSGTLTQAQGTDNVLDPVFKAMTKIETVGQAMPDGVLFNPNDWQGLRLAQSQQGIYYFGPPTDQGVTRVWGLPVTTSTFVTSKKVIVGDFGEYSELAFRAGIEFEVSNSHADFFQRGVLAIRAQIRVAFTLYRPAAFCVVTLN